MNTFRNKVKPQFKDNNYESSLNPFSRNFNENDLIKAVTVVRKKMFEPQSFKKTDPINLKYETVQSQPQIR
jgi:hypothetical protein